MKLPQLKFKPKFKFSFSLIINPILALVILMEIYFAYSLLYKNLNPQASEVVINKIVKVDLKAYQDTTNLIKSKQDFVPDLSGLKNLNPFKYQWKKIGEDSHLSKQ